MAEITIGSETFDVYLDVPEITAYATGSFGDDAVAWEAAEEDLQARAGVAATRTLDRQVWQGEKTDPDQLHAFPRTGLTYPDGTAVADDAVPQQVLDADAELAMALVGGSTAQTSKTTIDLTKRLKAGSAEIENFRASETEASRFPLPVMELIGFWLGGGAASVAGSEATGVCETTSFDRPHHFSRGF